jgi:hypothetical protein
MLIRREPVDGSLIQRKSSLLAGEGAGMLEKKNWEKETGFVRRIQRAAAGALTAKCKTLNVKCKSRVE